MDPKSLGVEVLVAVLCSEAIQMVKISSWFPWFTMETGKANRYLGLAVAFFAGLGIHVSSSGNGTYIITGLAWASIGHALLQWAQQQAYYRLTMNKQTLNSVKVGDISVTTTK